MQKILELDDRFPTGEPTVVMLATSDRGKWFVEKTASPAYEYIKHVTPRPGKTVVLVNALGAFETYDDNRNGDGFPARSFHVGERTKCGHAECNPDLKGWIADGETLLHHYKTFEKHGGIYRHHVNKDPSKSRGTIEQAFWNDRMQRVELLLEIVNDKDAELVKKIQDGEFPAVSMGCHVRYDVCSVCGHRAPTRKEYCEHARFKMRQVDKKTGEKVCVLNPSPKFFDISFVFRPADPTGFMMKKVAHAAELRSSAALGEKVADHEAKRAEVRKLSDIQKEIAGGAVAAVRPLPTTALARQYRDDELPKAVAKMPRLDAAKVAAMLPYSLAEVVSTLASKNASLATGELARLFVLKTAGVEPSRAQLDRVVALQPLMLEVLASHPDVGAKLGAMVELDARHVRPELLRKLGAWVEKRGGVLDYAQQAFHQPGAFGLDGASFGPGYLHNASEPPKTDLLTMTDPNTGAVHQTTRGAAMGAHNTDTRAALIGGGLLGALYFHGLGRLGLNRLARAAVAAPLGYASAKGLLHAMHPYRHPDYQTDQGPRVSGGTEFVKASAALDFGPTGLMHKAALDYAERVGLGPQMGGALRREVARHSPRLAAWLGDDADLGTKVAALVADLEAASGDPAAPPTLDLDRLAPRLANLLAD